MSSRTGFVQIPSEAYLSRVGSKLFHYAGRWSVVISGTVKSVTVTDLIVPGFMVALMVHLALTRLNAEARRGALSYMCARDNTEISC